jgi:predicted acetyltransferase
MLRHDLVREVRMGPLPDDDPAPLLVEEPRELHPHQRDGIWLRVVDAERTLALRPYGASGELAIRVVEDVLCPWNEGTYRVTADGPKSEVRRSDGVPDLVSTPRALASLVSGYASATALHRAGLLDAKDPETLVRADRMLATHHAPHCPDVF